VFAPALIRDASIEWSFNEKKKEYPMFREEVAKIEGLAERIIKLRGSL
jgi:hypothetical protein